MNPTESGYWSAKLESLPGSAVIVEVYHDNGGIPQLESSSKLRAIGQSSTPVALLGGHAYQVHFTPYGKGGESILTEHWIANAPPTACFTATPTSANEDETVVFDATCSADTDGYIKTYEWDFGDANIGSGLTANHAFAAAGSYPVTLKVTDDLGAWDSQTESFTVAHVTVPPVAAFGYTPAMVYVNDIVAFDASDSSDADGTISSYDWVFGDGNTGSGIAATNAYTAAGPYVVTLTVTDNDGLTDSVSHSLVVYAQPIPPVASFITSPAKPLVGAAVSFDASGSTDPDDAIVSYVWDFGDGYDGTGKVTTHAYASFGTFTVTLTVTDASTLSDSATDSVHVYAAPVASFTFDPASPLAGDLVSFDASGSSDADGTLVSYTWTFGDGNDGSGVTASNTYVAAGSYDATLTVTDSDGFTTTLTKTVVVRAQPVPPVADFTFDPAAPRVGDPVHFDASLSTDVDGTIVSYAWDFGDGATGAGKTADHSFSTVDTFVVTLTVTDSDDLSASATKSVVVGAQLLPPTAWFLFSPEAPRAGDLVHFDGSGSSDADGTVVGYAWDFGDMNSGSGALVDHAFASAGTFTVTLTVTDSDGLTGVLSKPVVVAPQPIPPTAAFEFSPASPIEGDSVHFDASTSVDPDGLIVSYAWDFGDGGTGAGKTADHAFAVANTYTVGLTVTDDDGLTGTIVKSVTVSPPPIPPVASFVTAPAKPLVGELVSFDASASTDADDAIVSYVWDFGDGNGGSGKVATHAYLAPGTFTVTLTVTDESLLSDSATGSVKVYAAPLASFLFSPTAPRAGDLVTFDASASSDADGTIVSYAWTFGDGESGSGVGPTHAYAAVGLYPVTLTVTDSDGLTGTATKTVNVGAQPVPPTAAFDFTPAKPLVGATVSFDASASTDPDDLIVTYAWDFGDGNLGSGKTATHAYASYGVFVVTLTVTDASTLSDSVQKSVRVYALPIAEFSSSPAKPLVGTPVSFDASSSSDPDGTIASYVWDFGDLGSGSGKTASHAYAAAGAYVVTLTVTDADGFTASVSHTVTIYTAPIADFTWTPAKPLEGAPVSFDASGSSDPDGSIASYAWTFGDGDVGSGKTASHTFASWTTYTVSLTVTDADGFTASVSKNVRIYAAPTASFGWSPSKPLEGTPVAFDASASTDPDGSIASYAWTFGDTLGGTGMTPSHTYAAFGSFIATLTVTDADGFTASVSHTVLIYAPPTAAFSSSPSKPLAGDLVAFDASASVDPDGTIASYDWDFGDLASGSGVTASHAFAGFGSYLVTLTVTDADGFTASISHAVKVYVAPSALFGSSPAKPLEGTPVSFDASASADPDGTIASYAWTFGDGGVGSGKTVTHTYVAWATYHVTLTVTDADGFTASYAADVKVYAPPVAAFGSSPAKPLVGDSVSFDASASTDPDGTIVSYEWVFGDLATGGGKTATHAYGAFGSYTVTLTVTDADGFTASISHPVKVYALPSASFTSSPAKPLIGALVSFDASGSSDPDGTIASYAWDFGDLATGSGMTASHSYAAALSYVVTLTVTDADGFTAAVSRSVRIYAAPIAAFSASPAKPLVGALVSFDASSSFDPDGTIASYAWDFGDGNAGTGIGATHTYAAWGPFVVALTVTDTDGFTGAVSHTVHVYALPVAAFGFSPAKPLVGELVTLDASSSSDPDGTLSAYHWDLGDGNTASGQVATHAYLAFGVYPVTLTVTDADGFTAMVTHDVKVYAPPSADFSYTPANPLVFETISFDGGLSSDPDGSIAIYNWEFGDGTYLTGKTATHAYETGGLKTVTLAVTDSDGFMDTATKTFTVLVPPIAQFTWAPSLPLAGELVGFDASGSWDPDGSIVSYAWGFGDLSGGSGVNPTHVFAAFGSFSVTLTVTDSSGLTDQVTHAVRIAAPPVAAFTWSPTQPLVGQIVTFDASDSSDPDGTITAYSWEFGDGNYLAGKTATHAYASFGPFNVIMMVTDADGLTATVSHSVTALAPPTASFSISPASPNVGDTVTFDASASGDVDGTIVTYAWDFGDGTGSGKIVTHNYATAGTYHVVLTVTDDDGLTASAEQDAVVSGAPVQTNPSWRFYDFFAVPYGEWWDMRSYFTADHPVNANCFSAEGVADGWCIPADGTIPDTPSYPYTNWVPSLVDAADGNVFAPYRFTVDATGLTTYAMAKPVILPTCADLKAVLGGLGVTYDCPVSMPTGGSVSIEESMDYITNARAAELRDVDGCPDVEWGNDGFLSEVKLTLTMDAAAAARLFGVTTTTAWTPGDPSLALLSTGCGVGDLKDPASGRLERGMQYWLTSQATGPYDVANALGAEWSVSFIEATGSYDAVSGKHTLVLDYVGRGNEVLTARWFYWGATAYKDGVNLGTAPAGWWGMETPWLESFQMSATIGTDPVLGTGFDASASGVIQNHFRQAADAGEDGVFGTSDDVAKWEWMPVLGDRQLKSTAHPVSELTWYSGYTYVRTAPGSARYGTEQLYDYTPAVWNLKANEGQKFEFPTTPAVLYDPFSGPVVNDPFGVVVLTANEASVAFSYSVPATGVGTYSSATRILSVVGPTTIAAPPMTSGGKPLESRAIYNLLALG